MPETPASLLYTLQIAKVRPTGAPFLFARRQMSSLLLCTANMLHIWTLPQTTQFLCTPMVTHQRIGLFLPVPTPPPLLPLPLSRGVFVQVTLYAPGAGLGSAPAALASERSPGGKASKRKRGGARARQK